MSIKEKVLLAVAIAAGAVIAYYIWDFVRVVQCLDGGYRWDYEQGRCDEPPH